MPQIEARTLQDRAFLLLLVLLSVALVLVALPFSGALLWAVIITIVFDPLHKRLLRAMPGHRNRVALLTLLIVLAVAIIPAIVLGVFLFQEASGFYAHVRAGNVDFDRYFAAVQHRIPSWASQYLTASGLTDFDATLSKLGEAASSSFERVATQALGIGQSMFGFLLALGVMLYTTYFLLRDGDAIAARIAAAAPLHPQHYRTLTDCVTTMIRATIKGSLVVAIIQGSIGGVVFWALDIRAALLWAVAMAVLAFLPVVGTGLIWVPVAIWLLATGAIWQGLVLALVGIFIIGLVDNVVRPVLVGRDTSLPDWMVLLTTLGGLAVFGANGVVIGPVIAALFLTAWGLFRQSKVTASD